MKPSRRATLLTILVFPFAAVLSLAGCKKADSSAPAPPPAAASSPAPAADTATATVTAKTNELPRKTATLAKPTTNAFGKVLIFRNSRSWNRKPDFEEALTEIEIAFEVKPSSDMANAQLAPYGFVIIPGGQWENNFYNDYATNAARFDRYVNEGGTLLLELNGAERDGITLPGGPKMIGHPSRDNVILLANHPILLPLAGRQIHANYASHGYLEGVPTSALVLAAELEGDQPATAKPTFVEYAHGKGRVIAACQCFHDRDGSGRGPLMESSLVYAAEKEWFKK